MASSSDSSPGLDEPFSKRRRTASDALESYYPWESEEMEPTRYVKSVSFTVSFEIFVTWIYKGVVEDIDIGNWASTKQAAIEALVLGVKWNWATSADDPLCVCRLELRDSELGNCLFDQLAYDLVHVWKNHFGEEYPGLRQSLQLLTEEQPELAVRMLETVCREGFGQSKSPSREKG